MGLGNMLILSQVTIFVLLFIVSFFIFVPLVVNSAQFNGHCLLFAEGVWTQENSSVHHDYFHVSSWGTSSACDFPILVGVVGIPFSFFYILWLSIYLFRRTEPSWLAGFITLSLNLVLTVLTLCAAIIVTLGFHRWCQLLAPARSCESVEFFPFLEEGDIFTGHFYMQFAMAQFGLWVSLVGYIIEVVLASRQMFVYHRYEDFFISMHRERQRLVQKLHRPSPIV